MFLMQISISIIQVQTLDFVSSTARDILHQVISKDSNNIVVKFRSIGVVYENENV